MENGTLYTIDVKDKVLGRVASEVASILRGKNSPEFKPHVAPNIKVKILNIKEIKLTGNKAKQKTYKRYSGYPGGLKILKFEKEFGKNPQKVFLKTVEGMLARTKIRKPMLKNLIFE